MSTETPEITDEGRRIMTISREADAKLDASRLREIFTADVRFQIGALPEVSGVDNVVEFISGFYEQLTTMEHQVSRGWQVGDTLIYEAIVTWHLKDGRSVSTGYANHIDLSEGKARRYRIYIDTSPLAAPR